MEPQCLQTHWSSTKCLLSLWGLKCATQPQRSAGQDLEPVWLHLLLFSVPWVPRTTGSLFLLVSLQEWMKAPASPGCISVVFISSWMSNHRKFISKSCPGFPLLWKWQCHLPRCRHMLLFPFAIMFSLPSPQETGLQQALKVSHKSPPVTCSQKWFWGSWGPLPQKAAALSPAGIEPQPRPCSSFSFWSLRGQNRPQGIEIPTCVV